MDNKNTESSSSSSTDPTPSTTTAATTVTGGDNARRHHHNNPLRHLHRFSHKISKPSHSHSSFDSHPLLHHTHHHHPQQQNQNQPNQNQNQQNQQNNTNNQPPVYNINKNDFRDVVQKLTGNPPPNISSPPPPPPPPLPPPPPPSQQVPVIQAPKPPSSRLQRIRPPPLSQISNRPPLPLGGPSFPTPSSPLPPLPSCHAAAESPITAYMRFLHGSGETNSTGFTQIRSLNSPKFNELAAGGGGEQQMIAPPVVPFGCFPSPRSPGTLFSPTGSGQFVFPQLPVSPSIPAVPSPK